MPSTPKTINEYLARLTPDKRAALQAIRRAVSHCSFFPGAYPIRACKTDLKGYKTSKGTVRFPVERPLPAALVRKLVKARIAKRG